MRNKAAFVSVLLTLAVVIFVGCAPAEPAEPVEPSEETLDFSGDTIRLIVPFGAGGSADTVGRAVAEQIREFIPGNPVFTVDNMVGAGGSTAMNELNKAVPDGRTWLVHTAGIVGRWIAQVEGHDTYDLRAMRPLAAMGQGIVLYTRPDVGDAAELSHRDPLRSGHQVGIGALTLFEIGVSKMFDWPTEQVYGYDSYREVMLAVLRGEVELGSEQTDSFIANVYPEIEAGNLVPLLQSGFLDGNTASKDPRLPDIPLVSELYEEIVGGDITDSPYWPEVAFPTRLQNLGFTFRLPPGTPEEIYDLFLQAFIELRESEQFIQAYREAFRAEPVMRVGAEVEEAFELLVQDAPQEAIDALRE